MKTTRAKLSLMTVIPIWLIIVFLGLFFASKSTEVVFDSSGSLYWESIQPRFDNKLSMLISGAIGKPLAQTAVHIVSGDGCLCQLTASRHIREVKDKASSFGKTNITVNIEDIPGLNSILNSTPAIAIFDDNGSLAYLGPYSTGIGCLSGNGTVEPYLDIHAAFGAIIPFEARGCYCSNT